MSRRRRLDAELLRRGLVASRTQAGEAIDSKRVLVNGVIADKSSRQVDPADAIVIEGPPPRFVSRGGDKLDAAEKASIEAAIKDVGARLHQVETSEDKEPAPTEEPVASAVVAQLLVTPQSPLVGRSVRQERVAERYDIIVVGTRPQNAVAGWQRDGQVDRLVRGVVGSRNRHAVVRISDADGRVAVLVGASRQNDGAHGVGHGDVLLGAQQPHPVKRPEVVDLADDVARDHQPAGADAAHLAGAVLDDDVAQGHLAIAAERDLAAAAPTRWSCRETVP